MRIRNRAANIKAQFKRRTVYWMLMREGLVPDEIMQLFLHARKGNCSLLNDANTTIIKCDLQLAIIIHAVFDFRREPNTHGMHTNRLGTSDLTHYINIMHATINERRNGIHQVLMHLPLLTR
jgi:hypothetical protein